MKGHWVIISLLDPPLHEFLPKHEDLLADVVRLKTLQGVSQEAYNKPLAEKRVYTVATNDFVAAGGDGYDMLKECKVIFSSGEMLRNVFAAYVGRLGKVSPGIEGRIVAK